MYREHDETICEILSSRGLLAAGDLDALHRLSRDRGESLALLAVEEGLLGRDDLLRVVAADLGCGFAPAVPDEVPGELASLLEAEVARRYGVVPVCADASAVELLAIDPFNPSIADDLGFALGKTVRIKVADPAQVEVLLAATYGTNEATADGMVEEAGGAYSNEGEPLGESELSRLALEKPVIRFVDRILQEVITEQASDVHFEPLADALRIRYRIDGTLRELPPSPARLSIPVISRLKVLAHLDISERRVPQDGRIRTPVGGRPVDLRVSTLPTRFGESVVLRVLDRSVVDLDLDRLGLSGEICSRIRELVARPNGIFIVTGPTGSGKTTTLYGALKAANGIGRKILTAEDPVEYEIDGVMQVAVDHRVGLDFTRTLRAFLRQDPDLILVGEIRDPETARIAVQASLTGHVVLSTLHTNDAPGAVTRLLDMGLEPFLISASLEAVLAQRLVRRICRNCRENEDPDGALLHRLEMDPDRIVGRQFFRGRGCGSCDQTGFRGRFALFELFSVTDAIRERIDDGSPALSIREAALAEGMQSLREAGLAAVFNGSTTVGEVLKCI